MGLTQHRNAVATIREIVNLLLLRGTIGQPGAGVCPVRGHSNVQGDRTMGIWENARRRVPRRAARPSSASTRRAPHGYDTVDAIRAMRDGGRRCSWRSAATSPPPPPTPTVTAAAARDAG